MSEQEQDCPDCQTSMLPADNFSCEKADWVCPNCAPDFVLMRATTFANVDIPKDEWNDEY
jgi:transposase-like protein